MARNVLTDNLSEPLNGSTTATVDIGTRDGNLIIDSLTAGDPALATGTLQYFEKQGPPARTLNSSNGQTHFTLRGADVDRPWFRVPWAACIGATEWQIHLNPAVAMDITARTGGGNVTLNLAGMAVTRVSADTGGGNMDVVLPADAANLSVAARTGGGNVFVNLGSGLRGAGVVDARSGAGNVVVRLPGDVAARIHVMTGLGKTMIDRRFSPIDRNTYQSPDYGAAANRVEITVQSGAGNVTVDTR